MKGETKDNNSIIHMRDHPCFCVKCLDEKCNECNQVETVGTWKIIKMKKLDVEKAYDKKGITESLKAMIKFFDWSILQTTSMILIGVMMFVC